MNRKILSVILIALSFLFRTHGQEVKNQSEMERGIDSIFLDFQKEKFLESTMIREESGWAMALPSGKEVPRSFLVRQADTVISFGTEAVPYLFRWVMSDILHLRYIAVYSLEQITGIAQPVPIFEKKDPDDNRQKAIKIWMEWYETQEN